MKIIIILLIFNENTFTLLNAKLAREIIRTPAINSSIVKAFFSLKFFILASPFTKIL